MRILGIDPGYAIMGYGVIEKTGSRVIPICCDVIMTDKDLPMPQRLKLLYNGLMDVIGRYGPLEASIEQLYFNTNSTTAIGVGQARGVAILACINSGLEIYEYTPLEIKMSVTGYGRADKKQMQQSVTKLLGLSEIPQPDDAADALAAALCHSHTGELRKKLFSMK